MAAAGGVVVGLGFLTKMLQAFLVVPALALVYLLTAPTPLRRRLWQLALAGVALLVSAGWWVAIVAVVPARPHGRTSAGRSTTACWNSRSATTASAA